MFYDNGIPIYATVDFESWKILQSFWWAVYTNGWQHESQGIWRGDMAGTSGLTIAEWVDRQRLTRTRAIVQATGFTYAHISKVANNNDLKPVSKGRWELDTVAQLLKLLGRLARCPKCKGVAGLDKQCNVTCFECE